MVILVGNRKRLTSLLLLCIIITPAVIPPWAEAQITCSGIIKDLLPCNNYISNGGEIPEDCCDGYATVRDFLKTTQDRQSACECMKGEFAKGTPEQLYRVLFLPALCGVPFPFMVSPKVDCSKVPKIIN